MSESIAPILFTYLLFFFVFFCSQQNYNENIARLLERQRAINEKSDPSWEEYKLAYGKIYANDEDEKLHRDAFLSNKVIIQEHNVAFVRGVHNFTLDYSHLTDWTPEELKALSDYRPNKAAAGIMKEMAKLRAIAAKKAALERRQILLNELARL